MINKLKNLIELEKEAYVELMVVARQEAYTYFDQNIRKLPRKKDGSFDGSTGEMSNNDADAFRHAYASGIFTIAHNSLYQLKQFRANQTQTSLFPVARH